MTEDDSTKNLSDRQILLALRQVVGALVERVGTLERRTNPLPPNYDERFSALEKAVRLTNHKLDELNANILDVKANYRDLAERVTALEGRPN
jgi:hypothetical protein